MKGALARLLVLALVCCAFAVCQQPVYAMCVQPQEEGNWTNIDPNTRGVTRLQLRFVCQDQILNGQPYPPGPPWYVHIYGKCSTTDCDWNEVGAQLLNSGYIYGVYYQGFAKRFVYARMSQLHNGQLWVYIWTDFKDTNRKDYAMSAYFIKE